MIDMAYSCMERGVISKMPGDRKREQGKRYREEKTCASPVQGADNANLDQRNGDGSRIWWWRLTFLLCIFLLVLVALYFGVRGPVWNTELFVTVPTNPECYYYESIKAEIPIQVLSITENTIILRRCFHVTVVKTNCIHLELRYSSIPSLRENKDVM